MSRLLPDHIPKSSRLDEVVVGYLTREVADLADPFLMLGHRAKRLRMTSLNIMVELCRLERRADVVRVTAVVIVDSHLAVALEWAVYRRFGCVCSELLVVNAETVTSRVGVREESGLKDWLCISICCK